MDYQAAVVGSGPAGLFATELLAKLVPGIHIDVFDRLPAPYGLVRYGIAPDHLSTKNIAKAFERTLQSPGIRFMGNVEIGRDLSYEELKAAYDVVILSIGSALDRPLGIPRDDLAGCYGSAEFVGWYNGHPDHRDLAPMLQGKALAVVGNGNVALDVVRILAKTVAELTDSDIAAHAGEAIAASTITDLYLIGRRGPVEASFTSTELGELGELERCDLIVDAQQIPSEVGAHIPEKERKAKERNLEILRGYAARAVTGKPVRMHLLFCSAPQAVIGDDRVRGLLLERTRIVEGGRAVAAGEQFEIAVDAVVAAIGYRTHPFAGVPFDDDRGIFVNAEGQIEPGVYAAGWCKHGPRGVVGTNRTEAQPLVQRIVAELDRSPDRVPKPGGGAIDELLRDRGVTVVDFAAWNRVDKAERARAQNGKPREKIVTIGEMVEVALAALLLDKGGDS